MSAARRRQKTEDEFVLIDTRKEFAELRRNAEFFERFVTYASSKLGIAERLIVGRLRMVFCGRTPPASFALLAKEFFRSGAHYGLVEEMDTGIRFQASPEYMQKVKKFTFGLPKIERIVRVICVNRIGLAEGIYLFVHAPDQRDRRKAKTVAVDDKSGLGGFTWKNDFWDQFQVWPEWVDWGRQRHSIFWRKTSDDFSPIDISNEGPTGDETSDRIGALQLTINALDVLFRVGDSWAGPFRAAPNAFSLCLGTFPRAQRESVAEDAAVDLQQILGEFAEGWAHVWCPCGHVGAELRIAGAKIRARLVRQLAGVRKRYRDARPFLTIATIDDLEPGLNTDILAARNALASAWTEFITANNEAVAALVRNIWNDTAIPLCPPESAEPAEPLPRDIAEPEAVAYLQRVASHEVGAFSVISGIVRGDTPERVVRKFRWADGISLGAAVVDLADGPTDHISVASGFTLSSDLFVALSAVFDVTFEGDAEDRQSQMLVRARQRGTKEAQPVRFHLRNRIRGWEVASLRIALGNFIGQRRKSNGAAGIRELETSGQP